LLLNPWQTQFNLPSKTLVIAHSVFRPLLRTAVAAKQVVRAAHSVGLKTTSTLMFGHLEHGPVAWARHLIALRDLQRETRGITEFVPLPFVHMKAPLFLKVENCFTLNCALSVVCFVRARHALDFALH
jgi:2-iminoacetate synthase ThiH